MGTVSRKNKSKSTGDKVTVLRFMNYFYSFSKKDQSKIASQINQTTFKEQWEELDKILPDVDLSEEEVMNEVRAVRYGLSWTCTPATFK